MSFALDLQVFGEDILRRRFQRFQVVATDMSPAFAQVVGVLRDSTVENFRTRGVSGGSRWRDLKPETLARKRRLGQDYRILIATGRLYGSLVGPSASTGRARHFAIGQFVTGSGDHVETITATSLTWGSRVPYGVYHQSTRPRKVIPYRPPVKLSERRKREIVKVMQRVLVEGTR